MTDRAHATLSRIDAAMAGYEVLREGSDAMRCRPYVVDLAKRPKPVDITDMIAPAAQMRVMWIPLLPEVID